MQVDSSSVSNFAKLRLLLRFDAFLPALLVASLISGQYLSAQAMPPGEAPSPRPAISAVVAAFNEYEVVGMSEAHGIKDADDFILDLIRTPTLLDEINDIAVECGNSLYQPELDRYINGEAVLFADVRKVWRNTTQQMCGTSGFFEQLFPLVRAINQKLPPEKRIRVLACDPPVDWAQVKTAADLGSAFQDRNQSIASVMVKEVLSKHRKALMLFGYFHLTHESTFGASSAVAMFEKQYPKSVFVIGDMEGLDLNPHSLLTGPYSTWPIPSLLQAKGTWLGAMTLSHFTAPPFVLRNCVAKNEFPEGEEKPMERLVDAFLYLGPPTLALREQMPADIALDSDFVTEFDRRAKILGDWSMDNAANVVRSAEDPFLNWTERQNPEAIKSLEKECRDRIERLGKHQ